MDVDIETSRTASAGAASAYALRRVAAHAGAYAPGIDARLFFELSRGRWGGDLIQVAQWFGARGAELQRRGYRIGVRLVAFKAMSIVEWVTAGAGYRAAVLATSSQLLHPDVVPPAPSAFALVCDAKKRGTLTIGDPFPVPPNVRAMPDSIAETLQFRTLMLFWLGYS